jgi:hypothetical protein
MVLRWLVYNALRKQARVNEINAEKSFEKKLPKIFGRYDEKFLPLQPLSERNRGANLKEEFFE